MKTSKLVSGDPEHPSDKICMMDIIFTIQPFFGQHDVIKTFVGNPNSVNFVAFS